MRSNLMSLRRTEFVWNTYGIIAKPSDTPDVVLSDAYWQHVDTMLRPLDLIHIVAEDGSYEMQMRVVQARKGAVRFRVLSLWQADDADSGAGAAPASSGQMKTEYAGPHHKHRVVDIVTKQVLAHGFATAELARDAMENLLRQRAA